MTESPQQPVSQLATWLVQIAPIASGCGAGLACVDERLSWLAWFALIPIGWSWSIRPRLTPSLVAIFCGGLLFHGLSLDWLRTCYSDGSEWFGPMTYGWIASSALCAALFVAMWHYGQLLVRTMQLPVALALPLAWVSMEFAKHYAGLIFVQMEFPWTKLGLTQAAWTQVAQIADLGGELFLSFLVCMTNGAIVDGFGLLLGTTLLTPKRLASGAILGAVLFMASWSYGDWRTHQSAGESGPVIALMGEMDLPPYLDVSQITELAQSPTEPHPNLLLWSELAWHHKLVDSSPITPVGMHSNLPKDLILKGHRSLDDYQEFLENGLLKSAVAVDAVLVLGCERLVQANSQWQRFNSVVCVNPASRTIKSYDKQRLCPWGEFLPFATGDSDSSESQFAQGTRRPSFQIIMEDDSNRQRNYNFQVAICYDLCFSQNFQPRDAKTDSLPVDFLVHCGAEGQDPTGALARVLLKTAQFRAIENRRAIVRNVNFGYSGAIDSNGRILHKTKRQPIQQSVMLAPLPIDDRFSGYSLWGDWPLGMLCAMTAVVAWCQRVTSD